MRDLRYIILEMLSIIPEERQDLIEELKPYLTAENTAENWNDVGDILLLFNNDSGAIEWNDPGYGHFEIYENNPYGIFADNIDQFYNKLSTKRNSIWFFSTPKTGLSLRRSFLWNIRIKLSISGRVILFTIPAGRDPGSLLKSPEKMSVAGKGQGLLDFGYALSVSEHGLCCWYL